MKPRRLHSETIFSMVTASLIAGGLYPPAAAARGVTGRWHSRRRSAKERAYTVAMPIYEYRCDKGHTFDVMQRMADEPLTSCEQCAAPAVRVLHAPAVHFKGSGFYNTDYGTKKRAREKSAETKAGKSEGNSSGDGGDSKSTSDSGSSSSDSKSGGGSKKAESAAA
jgi:putative FmdB family regulatory protein